MFKNYESVIKDNFYRYVIGLLIIDIIIRLNSLIVHQNWDFWQTLLINNLYTSKHRWIY